LLALASKLCPTDIEVLHLCGVLHRRLGDAALAFAQFARVLEQHPDFAYTEFEIGHTCLSLRQTGEALRWYRKSIESAPEFVPAYLAAARTERMLGNGLAALDLAERGLVHDPEHADLLRARAELLAGQAEDGLAATADPRRRLTQLNRSGRYAEATLLARDAAAALEGDEAALLEAAHVALARSFDRDAIEAAARAREAGRGWCDTAAAASAIRAAVTAGRPFALIRLGDGEARFLACLDAGVRAEIGTAAAARIGDSIWRNWFRAPLAGVAEAELERLATMLGEAVQEADLVGVPTAERLASDHHHFGYLGFLAQAATELEGARFADAAVNLRLHEADPFYAGMLAGTPHLTVIGPHPELAGRLARRLSIPEHATLLIPGEDRLPAAARQPGEAPHFPERFNAVLAALESVRPGGVTLVAGGLLGKIYAGRVRARGGIALDIGSLADAWMGLNTRPGQLDDIDRWKLE
jgi:hypothetical protein